jgi:hypothetical protein
MNKPHPTRNSEDASGLVAALMSNSGAFHKEVSRLYGDVGRLHGKVEAMDRVADRLHRKIESTRAPTRVLVSQDRVRRRKQSRRASASP